MTCLRIFSLTLWALVPSICFAATILSNTYEPLKGEVSQTATEKFRGKGTINLGDAIVRNVDIKGGVLWATWPEAELRYYFRPGLDLAKQQQFREACAIWATATMIICTQVTPQTYAAEVREFGLGGSACGGTPAGCASIGWGRQPFIEIYEFAWNDQRTIVHEIGHSLGLVHEHTRPDRGDYIIYYENNVDPNNRFNFSLRRGEEFRSLSEYDYYSVMHYANCDGSNRNGCTGTGDPALHAITPRFCHLDEIGGRANPDGQILTQLDIEAVRRAYMPRLMALFDVERSAQCGAREFKPQTVKSLCGESCASATPRSFRKNETEYDWGCGFMTTRDPVAWCSSIGPKGKDVVAQWTDKDSVHSKCWGGTLQERWTECACEYQVLTIRCISDTAPIAATDALSKLEKSGYWRDRSTFKLLGVLSSAKEQARMDGRSEAAIRLAIYRHYIRPYFGARASRLARLLKTEMQAGILSYENVLKSLRVTGLAD